MKKHYNITVTGTVQGVWYRKSTLNQANLLQLTGFVRNLPNGNVYIEAEGNKDKLAALIKWCHKGPEFAKVTTVTYTEADLKPFTTFEILK